MLLASNDGRRVSVILRGNASRQGPSYADPAWSADGRCLAARIIPATGGLMPINEVGVWRDQHQIAVHHAPDEEIHDGSPAWSPDGSRLAFVAYLLNGVGGGLFLTSVETQRAIALTPLQDTPSGHLDDHPAWSPDGSLIAFTRTTFEARRTQPPMLYLIRPNGSGLRKLTHIAASNPTWSPDSKWLAFDSQGRIAVVETSGKNLRYLTSPPRSRADSDPTWSPDGRTIAFVRNGDIWLTDEKGNHERLFIRHGEEPAWRRG